MTATAPTTARFLRLAEKPNFAPGLRSALRQPGLLLSVVFVTLVVGWAFVPGWFTSASPVEVDIPNAMLPPGPGHVFGTDNLGRDIYTRVVYGTANSLTASTIAVALALVVGTTIGLVAGGIGGRVDSAVMRVVDVMLAIPNLLLSLALVTALGYGLVNIAIAVGVTGVANFARLMRSDVLRVRNAVYVEAARQSGSRGGRILLRHLLPNAAGPVVSLAAIEFGHAVLAVAVLSFLGYGAPPPTPEWGRLVSEGRDYIASAWWMLLFPGLVITTLVLAINRIARAIEKEV